MDISNVLYGPACLFQFQFDMLNNIERKKKTHTHMQSVIIDPCEVFAEATNSLPNHNHHHLDDLGVFFIFH